MVWLPKPATRWVPQVEMIARAKRGVARNVVANARELRKDQSRLNGEEPSEVHDPSRVKLKRRKRRAPGKCHGRCGKRPYRARVCSPGGAVAKLSQKSLVLQLDWANGRF